MTVGGVKRKGGRQRIEPDVKKAEQYALRGLTDAQIAEAMGMGVSTFYEKKKSNPEFAEAIKRGRGQAIAMVADQLLAQVKGGNVTAMIFFLKTHGWKESSAIEITDGEDGIDSEGMAKVYAEMEQAIKEAKGGA